MSIESEAATDQRVAESFVGKVVGRVGRLGGAALVGYASYLFARTGSLPEFALVLPGAGAMAGGVRLGLERGAAVERMSQRQLFGGQVVVGVSDERRYSDRIHTVGASAGPFVVGAASGISGLEFGINTNPDAGFPIPLEVGATTLAVGAAMWVESIIERAGRATELQPRVHQFLHRLIGIG